jgi:ribosome-associated protein
VSVHIPDNELYFSFVRSSGAGGQNVNKTSSKVQVRWSIPKSRVFSWEQKQWLIRRLSSRLNSYGDLLVASEEERGQLQNRSRAASRLRDLVRKALVVPKIRKLTRPTRASKVRRLIQKKQRSLIKEARRGEED